MSKQTLSELIAEIENVVKTQSSIPLDIVRAFIEKYTRISPEAYDLLPACVSVAFMGLFQKYLRQYSEKEGDDKLKLIQTAFVLGKFKYLALFATLGLDPAAGNCRVVNDTHECFIVEYDAQQLICSREDNKVFVRKVQPTILKQAERTQNEKRVYYSKVISQQHDQYYNTQEQPQKINDEVQSV